ncbi:MAG: 4-hydroxy-3-methylbut-2-enyl diphosphate reductase [Candidatus Moranbacteria bacterium]|nr:4-hydroxy-3-methylbut-2-enyl diphosphate reductase [Candidatus Moranbacteria bacterium]
MKITLSKHAGFCEGVRRAYDMIVSAVGNPQVKKPIYVLGSLVHNADVVKNLEDLGVKKIQVDRNLFKNLRNLKSKIGTLVITAHGIGPALYEFCRKEKIWLIDTTCPRVIRVQRLAKVFAEKMHKLVIIGDKDHKETKGIREWSKNTAIIVEKVKELKELKLNSFKRVTVLFQTTQDLDLAEIVSSFVHNFCPDVKVINTICRTTHDRQNEVKKIARQSDAVVVIGSSESANSTRLWEIAKRINPRSYFIERADQIKKEWLRKIEKVGITAGASTPQWVIQEVVEYFRKNGT